MEKEITIMFNGFEIKAYCEISDDEIVITCDDANDVNREIEIVITKKYILL